MKLQQLFQMLARISVITTGKKELVEEDQCFVM